MYQKNKQPFKAEVSRDT